MGFFAVKAYHEALIVNEFDQPNICLRNNNHAVLAFVARKAVCGLFG